MIQFLLGLGIGTAIGAILIIRWALSVPKEKKDEPV